MVQAHHIVLGASTNTYRYSYRAIQRLVAHGYSVVAIGKSGGTEAGIPIITQTPQINAVHTVTLYLQPKWQTQYYHYILHQLQPQRLIFNPGSENQELAKLAQIAGIKVQEACTLVLLATGAY